MKAPSTLMRACKIANHDYTLEELEKVAEKVGVSAWQDKDDLLNRLFNDREIDVRVVFNKLKPKEKDQ